MAGTREVEPHFGGRWLLPAATSVSVETICDPAVAEWRFRHRDVSDDIESVGFFLVTDFSGKRRSVSFECKDQTGPTTRPAGQSIAAGRVRDCTITPYSAFWKLRQGSSRTIAIEVLNSSNFKAWPSLLTKVYRWVELPDDWDGEGGCAPTSAAADAIGKLALLVAPYGIPEPNAYIAGDGEIGLHWKHQGRTASLAFLPDNHVVAYCPRAKSKGVFKLDEPFHSLGTLVTAAVALREFLFPS
jgi:hypothetical protein